MMEINEGRSEPNPLIERTKPSNLSGSTCKVRFESGLAWRASPGVTSKRARFEVEPGVARLANPDERTGSIRHVRPDAGRRLSTGQVDVFALHLQTEESSQVAACAAEIFWWES